MFFFRLYYCNTLYAEINHGSFHFLKMVQKASAWLITRPMKYLKFIPVLALLHSLPVRFRINFENVTAYV